MPTTQSISQGVTYAETLPNFQSVLNVLPDNTQKLIAPRDVRDSFFTTWENIVFKKTTISTSDVQYIGIDQNDLTQKVYFGKKRLNGQEVMNLDLLSNDVDFYFYNTKVEPQEDYSTTIALLAGTNSFIKGDILAVPYLKAQVVESLVEGYINLEIRNRSFGFDGTEYVGGDINLLSDKGYISINGVVFPKFVDNVNSENNDKYLKFVWDGLSTGYATWSTIEIPDQPDPIDPANIFFTDPNPTPQALGGIPALSTFDQVPVTEMFRRLLYPYLKPTISTGFSTGVIECGDTIKAGQQELNYTITRKSEFVINSFTINPPDLQGSSNPKPDPTTIAQGSSISGTLKPVFNVNLPATTNNQSISVTSTITDTNVPPSSVPSTAGFSIVLPWYVGVSTTATNTLAGINAILGTETGVANKLTALLKTSASSTNATLTTVGLGGQGCIYFGYPSSYPDLTSIKDQSDFDVTLDFTKYEIVGIKSPLNRWGAGNENRTYKFYILTRNTGTPQTTLLKGNFQFKFNF